MPKSFDDIVGRPESQSFEWKRSLSLQREGLESLCGMINADGAYGSVLFGKAPDGQIIGVEPGNLDRAQQSISQTTRNKFEPAVQCTYEVLERDGLSVMVVSAMRNRTVPYHEFDGRAFIREGTVTRQLNLAEKQALQRQRIVIFTEGRGNVTVAVYSSVRCQRLSSPTKVRAKLILADVAANFGPPDNVAPERR